MKISKTIWADVISAELFLLLRNGMHMSRGETKWHDAFHATFMTQLCESNSQGVDWGVSQTFLRISRFTALSLAYSLSLQQTWQVSQHRKLWVPFWVAVKIQQVHINTETQAASVTASCVSGIEVYYYYVEKMATNRQQTNSPSHLSHDLLHDGKYCWVAIKHLILWTEDGLFWLYNLELKGDCIVNQPSS